MKGLTPRLHMLVRWAKVLVGRSYYHQRQGMGKAFLPGELAGYFNDLTAKTIWRGQTDPDGVPVSVLADERKVRFITMIVQKALGHWDRWLLERDVTDRETFLQRCRWLQARQDKLGGWPIWPELGLSLPSPYSAMTQGECISAFVRAWKLTGDLEYRDGARRSVELMCKPIECGGPAVFDGEELFLEEVPATPRSSILNGWIFALFGLYDACLAFKHEQACECFTMSLNTLKRHLQEYDTGYWSYYDVRGHLASPFYHELHIHQLAALASVDKDRLLREYRDCWDGYQRKFGNRVRALAVKAFQKLQEPGEVMVVR